ncbi:MAG: hypothetical protein KDD42_02970 [Bdellovibrionales bacterium]|nr:hypothetical protein [Bdellovibrionales bacterium]
MDFSKLYSRKTLPTMSAKERQQSSILIVESEANTRNTLRQTLISLDIGSVSDAPDHIQALKKIEERFFSHIVFESKKTSMPAKEFLHKALEYDNRIIAIPTSLEPTVDDVFDLLILGARGFLVKPFTTESVDNAIVWSTKGEPISESILYARNRNEALASLVLSAFGKLTTVMRQAKEFETARRELPQRQLALSRAVELGRTFAQGGEMALLEALVDFAAARAEGPATRLGRLRKFLKTRDARGTREEHASEESIDESSSSNTI